MQSWQFVNKCKGKRSHWELRVLVKRIISVAGYDMEPKEGNRSRANNLGEERKLKGSNRQDAERKDMQHLQG